MTFERVRQVTHHHDTDGLNDPSLLATSIKFALQKKSGVETRRVRGAYTLAELQSVVGQWWGCPNLRWQYRDPEGDMVTMTLIQGVKVK